MAFDGVGHGPVPLPGDAYVDGDLDSLERRNLLTDTRFGQGRMGDFADKADLIRRRRRFGAPLRRRGSRAKAVRAGLFVAAWPQ